LTVFSGAVGWVGQQVGLTDLSRMAESLDPYGARRSWQGELDGCAAALIVHD